MIRLLIFVLATGLVTESVGQPFQRSVTAQVSPYLKEGTVSAVVVGIVKGGATEVYGFGALSQDSKKTPDANTVFEIGSVTKVFTGILLADAVKRGEVQLDQSVASLCSQDLAAANPALAEIRLLQLSTHTSGLPRLPTNLTPSNPRDPYADYDAQKMNDFLRGFKPTRKPGTKSEYSNLAAGCLGQLLADRAGMSYEQLLQSRILKPLGMTTSTTDASKVEPTRLAQPLNESLQPDHPWQFQAMAGAGAIRSNVQDMLKFATANLHPPQGELGDALELAWQQHQAPLEKEDFAMGLGWHLARDGKTRWHNGQTGGYHSMLLVNRELDTAVVVLCNTATMEVDRLAQDIFRSVIGMEVPPRKFEAGKQVAGDIMKRYVGKYQLVPGFVLTVSTQGDRLMVGATGQPTFEVFPRSETEWFYKVVEATLTFKVDSKGQCNELDLFQNGVHQTAKRID